MGARQGQDRKRSAQAAIRGGLYVSTRGIQPLHGVESNLAWAKPIYAVTAPLLALLVRTSPKSMTTTERMGRAMIGVARDGYPKPVLESEDINRF